MTLDPRIERYQVEYGGEADERDNGYAERQLRHFGNLTDSDVSAANETKRQQAEGDLSELAPTGTAGATLLRLNSCDR